MIRSFKDKAAEAVFDGKCPKGFPADVFKNARRKLEAVHAAMGLDDLRSPPGNRLEALSGDRAGQDAIRMNDQRRICFCWADGGAESIEIVDYRRAIRGKERP